MNLIEFLRDKLTPTVEQKISSFLGESQFNVNTAVNNVLPTILGGLIQQGTTDQGAKKVMDIIKDGGHTGDVLDNISGLLDNYDKSQLLVTIGSNIFNHFFGNTATILTDKIASLSEIKNSSAASLLGIMSPLVLGAIGYVVHKENLGISGLKKLLDDQRDGVSKALPSLIAPHLPLRAIAPTPLPENEVKLTSQQVSREEKVAKSRSEELKGKTNDKSFLNTFLPWLFLIILFLLSLYYARSCQLPFGDTDPETISIGEFQEMDQSAGILDDSSVIVEEGAETTPIPPVDEVPENDEKPSAEKAPAVNTPSTRNRSSTVGDNSASSPTPSITTQQLRNTRSWVDVSTNSFEANSAEIQDRGEINVLASYLQQNPNATISIAPAGSGRVVEDRAYAIREQLYQKGIDVSRIIIEPYRGSYGSGSGVSIKVNR